MKSSNPISKIWDYFEEGLCVLLLAFMTVMCFANVLSRYVIHSSISFTEELTITAFVWISMIGSAVAYKRCAHMSMSFIQDQFSKKNQVWFALLSMICSVAFLAVLIYYGFVMVNNQIMLNSKTPALGFPSAFQGAAIPVGGIFMLIRAIQLGITQIIEFRKEGDAK